MIDFSVEPEFQAKLDWMDKFVREECETIDRKSTRLNSSH